MKKKILKIWNKLFTYKKTEYPENKAYKRFPFGEKLIVQNKEYRYLYTQGDKDVFFDEETIRIYLIETKHIIPD